MPSTIASTAPTAARSAPVAGGETYLIGRRGSPHVHEYRDFLERNRVSFRWIDVDRNPLVRHLEAAPALRRRPLPFFLFADGSHLQPSDRARSRISAFCAHGPSSRPGSGCTPRLTTSATTW